MFERKKSFFKFNVILLPWIILICIFFSLQIQCEKDGQAKAPEENGLSAEKVLQMEIEFANDLEEKFFSPLQNLFNNKNRKEADYDKMADKMVEFKEKMTYYKFDGYEMENKDQYKQHWKDAGEIRQAAKVVFSILSLRVIPVPEPIELKAPDDPNNTIIATGHAIIIYRIIKNSGNKETNTIGTFIYDAPHPRRCEW